MIKKMRAHFKRYFITGLLVVVPLYLTISIFSLIVGYMDRLLQFLPESFQPDTYLPFHIPGLGVIVTIAVIFLIGLLTTNLLGKRIVEIGDNILTKVPVFRNIYKPIKQFMETFFVSGCSGFRKVVLIEFPSKGMYSVGFLTGLATGEIQDKTTERVEMYSYPQPRIPQRVFICLFLKRI